MMPSTTLIQSRLNNFLLELTNGDDNFYLFTVTQSIEMDGYGIYLWCKKHKKSMRVSFECDDVPSKESVLKAMAECSGCIADEAAKIPPTRFPEGAEL